MSDLPTPNDRVESLLMAILTGDGSDLPTAKTRTEKLLLAIYENGSAGGGGTGGVTPAQVKTILLANTDTAPNGASSNPIANKTVTAALADKVDSTELTNYYLKTQTYSQSEVDTALSAKVDKVTGKGLSQENYTTEEKTKLAGLNNYDDTILTDRVDAIEGNYVNKTYVNEQIASAVSAYLEENPVSSGLTEEEVNTLIQSAIGNAMGGDY